MNLDDRKRALARECEGTLVSGSERTRVHASTQYPPQWNCMCPHVLVGRICIFHNGNLGSMPSAQKWLLSAAPAPAKAPKAWQGRKSRARRRARALRMLAAVSMK